MKTSSQNPSRLRNKFAHSVLERLITRDGSTWLCSQRKSACTNRRSSQKASTLSPALHQRQHLRPRSTFRPSEVWSRHTAYKTDGGSAMPQSKERQRCTSGQLRTSERKRPNQWPLAATIIACESERYSTTRLRQRHSKQLTNTATEVRDITGGMMPSMQTNSRTIKCEIARRTSMGPIRFSLPIKEFNETDDNRSMLPLTR